MSTTITRKTKNRILENIRKFILKVKLYIYSAEKLESILSNNMNYRKVITKLKLCIISVER